MHTSLFNSLVCLSGSFVLFMVICLTLEVLLEQSAELTKSLFVQHSYKVFIYICQTFPHVRKKTIDKDSNH